ncbi:hypothetical protein DM860_015026 [Cuscuta australis]|uniref:Reverse transcriptase zinc-binding domain-containing protein n=1 Tax=Cuscuta australis TaxID=267555 RepID=A0A328DE81_9ASTE|nr:hypothetical protein DM860_015026 [Cuscuta australis]
MSKGSLPFRYLGGPITASRISVNDCDKLVENMSQKIKSWGSKHLSYAGRVNLLNSVLFGIMDFLCRIFIMPTKVMWKIQSICRNFLWSSSQEYKKHPLVAWKEICLPKNNGGLGIKNLVLWNTGSIMRLVWSIAKKEDNLWIKWVHGRYLKNNSIWDCSLKMTHATPEKSC